MAVRERRTETVVYSELSNQANQNVQDAGKKDTFFGSFETLALLLSPTARRFDRLSGLDGLAE